MAPSQATIQNLNISDKNSTIRWDAYLGQALAAVPFVGMKGAGLQFLYNTVSGSLAALSPYNRGTTLNGSSVNTTLQSEPFRSFGDMAILDSTDLITSNTSCNTDQLCEQARSIVVRIFRELANQFFNGNGLGQNLRGINLRADITIDASAFARPRFALNDAREKVHPSTSNGAIGPGGNAWFSNKDAFIRLLQSLGRKSSKIKWVFHPIMRVMLPYYLGMPWFIDQNIITTSGVTTVYAVNLDYVSILFAQSDAYPASEKGIIQIPVPMGSSIAQMGVLIFSIFALQNNPGAIVKIIKF